MKKPVHNTHMLLPTPLWERLRDRAIIESRNITEIVVEAAHKYLESTRGKSSRR